MGDLGSTYSEYRCRDAYLYKIHAQYTFILISC